MKYLLPLLCCCLIAEAQSFKVYELLIPKDKIESFSNPQEMIEAAGRRGVTIITAYADLPNSKNGVWSIDQTYSMRYVKELDSSGRPATFADRKIGLQVQIKQLPNGEFYFFYYQAKLEAWLPIDSMFPEVLKPIFSSRKIVHGLIQLDDYTIMESRTNKHGVSNIIIKKIK